MKKPFSFISWIIVGIVLVGARLYYIDFRNPEKFQVTTWDSFGYYMYAPSVFIYGDVKELAWLHRIDSIYYLSGGHIYQANKHENGNYVYKYLGGVSVMQLPFFFTGHVIALLSDFPEDGFSSPYQFSISFGALVLCIISLFFFRKFLLYYFPDKTVAACILLFGLATNMIQYVAVDNAQSHAFILPLYVAVLFTTKKWHDKPSLLMAFISGYIIGLATICRPTEFIMLVIPLFWNTHTKTDSRQKWALVKQHKNHIAGAFVGGVLGILPQLLYWKVTTGSFVYDVGSKWVFLNPFFRVLFGWVNGWFIYTPVTIFIILGLLLLKKYAFHKSVLVFSLLNIWIIISWFDWRYGATYSTRALIQGLPVMILSLAAFLQFLFSKRYAWVFLPLGIFLIYLNLFQVNQYNNRLIHYHDMNRRYYGRIFLNNHPTPLDMSLLDSNDWLRCEKRYKSRMVLNTDSVIRYAVQDSVSVIIADTVEVNPGVENWLKISARVKTESGFYQSYLRCKVSSGREVKHAGVRLDNPISFVNQENSYAFFVRLNNVSEKQFVTLFMEAPGGTGLVNELTIILYEKINKAR